LPATTTTGGRTLVWQIAGITLSFLVLSAPSIWRIRVGSPFSYSAVTIAFAASVALVVGIWQWDRAWPVRTAPWRLPAATAAAALALLTAGAWIWLGRILWNPIDPTHADMLVVIREGIHRFLRGRDPYTLYHVPWEVPLPYGPVLWGPYLIPSILHADLRFVTLIGEVVIPACCGLAAVIEARRGQAASAIAWLILLAVIVVSPDLASFASIGHTPSYWPLFPVFAILVAGEQWSAAAFMLGILIVGRSTMVSVVPLFAMVLWFRARRQAVASLGIIVATIAILMLPFVIWDPAMLWYDMVASYPRIVKQVVWKDGGAVDTIGVTGWLLAHHLERFAELAQVLLVFLVYACAWRALKRGAPLLPWCALALAAFSMTALWPLYYLYFDVCWMLVVAACAGTVGRVPWRRHVAGWSALVAAIVLFVLVLFRMAASPFPVFDFTTPAGRRALYGGFIVGRLEGSEPVALIWGRDATVALPRASTAPATIVLVAEGVVAEGSTPQMLTALLNGTPLGTIAAARGWHDLRFEAPRELWIAGANTLTLHCATTTRPVDVGLGGDLHHIGLGLRRVEVVDNGARAR
jgi:hypothetical protein